MNFILSYFARMLLISGCLYGYYWFFLRNASFHRFNRFFLVGTAAIATLLPFIHIPVAAGNAGVHPLSVIASLHEITAGNFEESFSIHSKGFSLPWFLRWQNLAIDIYILIAAGFLMVLLQKIGYIIKMSEKYPEKRVEGIRVSMTNDPKTPFSFLKMIFWNNRLDLESAKGRQILQHEIYHVRQNHSIDLLFLESLRSIFWFNPIFHLVCKEIKATHEFLADSHAIANGDQFEYAEWLVWQSLGTNSPMLTHSFFNSHLKRRITMITKKETARPAFFSRFMILPLFFVLFCAFATTLHEQTPAVKTLSSKPFTIVIDAGHGGLDPGAISTSGVNEKDITLAIARKIEQLGPAYQIQVLMTREGDQLPGNTNTIHDGLRYRTDFANQHHADLFISIHVNAGTGYADKGMTIYLSEQNPFFNKSRSLGSSIIEEMKNTYSTNMEMRKRAEPIWVLKGTAMPAILMLCGNIDVPADLSFISDEHNQENIAKSVLQGVVHFEQHTADH